MQQETKSDKYYQEHNNVGLLIAPLASPNSFNSRFTPIRADPPIEGKVVEPLTQRPQRDIKEEAGCLLNI